MFFRLLRVCLINPANFSRSKKIIKFLKMFMATKFLRFHAKNFSYNKKMCIKVRLKSCGENYTHSKRDLHQLKIFETLDAKNIR